MALKLLKFALLAVAVLSLFDGTEQTCRRVTVPVDDQEKEICSEPRVTLVKLEVPEDFSFIEPSFVRVNQCKALSCDHRKHCVPKSIEKRQYTVNAYKENDGAVCTTVDVHEHTACHCQCQDPGCPKNMIEEEDSCACVCDPEKRRECNERRRENRDLTGDPKVMWSETACSCVCDTPNRHCTTGLKFDHHKCECVIDNSVEDSSEEDNSEENFISRRG